MSGEENPFGGRPFGDAPFGPRPSDQGEAGVTAPPGHPIGGGITRLTSTSESSALHPIFESQITG